MDKVPAETRTRIMQSIRSADTKMEVELRKALYAKGLRFRKNVKGLVGTPDIALKSKKIAIFLDSCFWHVCPIHFRKPSSNNSYWEKKVKMNKDRDARVSNFYQAQHWRILRFWEHELTHSFQNVLNKAYRELKKHG